MNGAEFDVFNSTHLRAVVVASLGGQFLLMKTQADG